MEKLQEVCKETFLKFDVRFDGVVKDNQQNLAEFNKRFGKYEIKTQDQIGNNIKDIGFIKKQIANIEKDNATVGLYINKIMPLK